MSTHAYDVFQITDLPDGWNGNVQPNRDGNWIAKAWRHPIGAEVSVLTNDPILAAFQVRAAAHAIAKAKVPAVEGDA